MPSGGDNSLDEDGEIADSPIRYSQVKPWDIAGCSDINRYIGEVKVGDGTFGVVLVATDSKTREKVALKKILTLPNSEIPLPEDRHKSKDYGIPVTTLREIKYLKRVRHPNCVELLDIAFEKGDLLKKKRGVFHMVFPFMDYDLTGLLANPKVTLRPFQIKCFMKQMLKGLEHLHSIDIIHRDIKCANILINSIGELKIADFGLARTFDQDGNMTAKVCTLWYRAPELIVYEGEKSCRYSPLVDVWGIGCIFGEMWKRQPILPGKDELDQLTRIFKLVGSPSRDDLQTYSELSLLKSANIKDFGSFSSTLKEVFPSSSYQDETYRLLRQLLALSPKIRLSATEALRSKYFEIEPYPAKPGTSDFVPPFPQSHEMEFRSTYGRIEMPAHKDYVEHNRRRRDDRNSSAGYRDRDGRRDRRNDSRER